MCLYNLPNSSALIETSATGVLAIPQIILLPPDLPPGRELGSSGFVRYGINFASVEFILYANFFVQHRRTCIVTATAAQAHCLRCILSETLLGPTNPQEHCDLPELQRECAAVGLYPPLRCPPTPDDLADILTIENEPLELGDGITV